MNLARVSDYVHALSTSPFNATCLGLTEIKEHVSHDALNRAVNGSLEFTTVLSSLVSRHAPKGGCLVVDDTILTQYSQGLSCVFKLKDTKTGAFTLAVNVVLLCWTDGATTIPIAFRIYQGKCVGKISLAVELLEVAALLGFTPTQVLFDSWYASQGVFDAVHALGAHFVTRLKKNRVLNGKQLRRYRVTPNWSSLGRLRGGTAVAVYRRGSKFYATSDVDLEWNASKSLVPRQSSDRGSLSFTQASVWLAGVPTAERARVSAALGGGGVDVVVLGSRVPFEENQCVSGASGAHLRACSRESSRCPRVPFNCVTSVCSEFEIPLAEHFVTHGDAAFTQDLLHHSRAELEAVSNHRARWTTAVGERYPAYRAGWVSVVVIHSRLPHPSHVNTSHPCYTCNSDKTYSDTIRPMSPCRIMIHT
jgi:Transposase DDE domain